MKSIIYCFAAALMGAPTSAQNVVKKPAPQRPAIQTCNQIEIDPRAGIALQKMAAAYRKLGDFSVTSLETAQRIAPSQPPQPAQRSRTSGRFGRGGRAALRDEKLDAQGKSAEIVTTQLSDGTNFYRSKERRPATVTPIAELQGRARERATKFFFFDSFGLHTIALALGSNKFPLLEGMSTPQKVTFRALRDGNSQIEASGPLPNSAPDAKFRFTLTFAPSGFLKQGAGRINDGQVKYLLDAKLSTPLKLSGSEDFNWTKFAPPISSNFVFPASASAPFERASKLYGALNSLSVRARVSQTQDGKTTLKRGGFSWKRSGLLRFGSQDTGILTVVDGKTRWNLRDTGGKTPFVSSEPLKADNKTLATLRILGAQRDLETLGGEFNILLRGESMVLYGVDDLTHLRARVLPSQLIQNQLCDVVEVVSRSSEIKMLQLPPLRFQTTYFFAQNDGRLLRMTGHVERPDLPSRDWVVDIESQDFAPTFDADTFRFIKPDNAVPDPDADTQF